jgi:hypothetical protein
MDNDLCEYSIDSSWTMSELLYLVALYRPNYCHVLSLDAIFISNYFISIVYFEKSDKAWMRNMDIVFCVSNDEYRKVMSRWQWEMISVCEKWQDNEFSSFWMII